MSCRESCYPTRLSKAAVELEVPETASGRLGGVSGWMSCWLCCLIRLPVGKQLTCFESGRLVEEDC